MVGCVTDYVLVYVCGYGYMHVGKGVLTCVFMCMCVFCLIHLLTSRGLQRASVHRERGCEAPGLSTNFLGPAEGVSCIEETACVASGSRALA